MSERIKVKTTAYRLADIPGYKEALQKEKNYRDAAWLNIPFNVCGIEIRQMTSRDFLILEHLQLIAPLQSNPTRVQLDHFLWLMAVKQGWRWLHSLRVMRMDHEKAMARLATYWEMTWMDTPGGSTSSPSTPSASWLAHNAEFIGHEFGWTYHYILDVPLRVLNQLINVCKQRLNPDYKVNALHGAVIAERLRKKNEEHRAKMLKDAHQSLVDLLNRKAKQ